MRRDRRAVDGNRTKGTKRGMKGERRPTSGYCAVAVRITVVAALVSRELRPRISRVIAWVCVFEPPMATGWPLATTTSVAASVNSMAPEASGDSQLILGVRRTRIWLPGRTVARTFSAVPTSLNTTPRMR